MKRVWGVVAGALFGLLSMHATASAANIFAEDGRFTDGFFFDYEKAFVNGLPIGPVTPDVLTALFNAGNKVQFLIEGEVQNTRAGGDTLFEAGPTDRVKFFGLQEVTNITTHSGTTHFDFGVPTSLVLTDVDGTLFTVPLGAGEIFQFHRGPGSALDSNGPTLRGDLPTSGSLFFSLGPDQYFFSHPKADPIEGLAYLDQKFVVNSTGQVFICDVSDINVPDGFGTTKGCFIATSEFELNPDSIALGGTSPWDFRSNDPARVHAAAVPEVSSLWTLGMGLGSLGVFRRRKLWA